ncbi:MAG: DUF962 domain-containing protein [Bdellovibrionota bacterium]
MVTTTQHSSFQEFWPYYLTEHSISLNRRLHFAGTFLIHVLIVYALLTSHFLLLFLIPILGYAFAWAGHFFVEKNRPATFKHPLWSLRADFKLFYLMCSGKYWS